MFYDAEGKPYEPEWPEANYVIGNPPFVGGTQMRRQLGDMYIDDLRVIYAGRVKGAADLVAYWFEKGRATLERDPKARVGLIATQGIRGGANRFTLKRVYETGKIFFAISDRDWKLEGATVHISMIAFSVFTDSDVVLNGHHVGTIFPNLTTGLNLTEVERLIENRDICFEGTKKHGPFDIPKGVARRMLTAPENPNQRNNAEVVKPWFNALDITRRPRDMYIVDFGTDMSQEDAAMYELPFEYVKEHVLPERLQNRREVRKTRWWLHGEVNPRMRYKLAQVRRFIATPRVSKHRVFAWVESGALPDSATCVFATESEITFGVLHSRAHELWARTQGTQLREVESGFRYTPKSTFDTFPFPWPPSTEPAEDADPRVKAIADAARELVRLRDAWLNPPGASEADLKARTLTNLYNKRPEWLANAHRTLDIAVFAAYGWPDTLTDQEILARLLGLNHKRAALQTKK